MKQSYFIRRKDIYPGSVIMNMRSFKAMSTKGGVCLFLSKDCFECLSPYETAE